MNFWSRLKHTLNVWKAFFSPIQGWKARLRLFRRGTKTWAVPYDDKAPHVMPWPVQWFPHRKLIETDEDKDKERGFVFLDSVCVDSGVPIEKGVATSCVRCGVHLHPEKANMSGGFDPPICRRCYWVIFFTV